MLGRAAELGNGDTCVRHCSAGLWCSSGRFQCKLPIRSGSRNALNWSPVDGSGTRHRGTKRSSATNAAKVRRFHNRPLDQNESVANPIDAPPPHDDWGCYGLGAVQITSDQTNALMVMPPFVGSSGQLRVKLISTALAAAWGALCPLLANSPQTLDF